MPPDQAPRAAATGETSGTTGSAVFGLRGKRGLIVGIAN